MSQGDVLLNALISVALVALLTFIFFLIPLFLLQFSKAWILLYFVIIWFLVFVVMEWLSGYEGGEELIASPW